MKNSIGKIWAIIGVLVLTLGLLTYWGSQSYKNSTLSIEHLLNPNKEAIVIDSLYKMIVQSDAHLSNFILTNDSLQWQLASGCNERVKILLDQTDSLFNKNPETYLYFDSLKALLVKKKQVHETLIDLKKQQRTQVFTQKALNTIEQTLSDTAFVDKAITQKGGIITSRDTIEQMDVVVRPDDYKGIGGLFRKITGRQRVQTDTIIKKSPHLSYNFEVLMDSSIVRDYYLDTTLTTVKSILTQVRNQELSLRNTLNVNELLLIQYNSLLLENVSFLLNTIFQDNQKRSTLNQALAKQRLQSSFIQILLIAVAGISLGFILLLILIRDVSSANTYRKRLEAEKEKAEELAIAKEVFLSKMSHEIRTPLHSISGFIHLLKAQTSGSENKKFIEGVIHANNYLNELINNILEQGKINMGAFRNESSPLFIPDLCQELELLFDNRQKEQNCAFYIEFSPELNHYHLLVDRIKLMQVLVNLLSNAFKYTRNGTVRLDIQLIKKNEERVLEIKVIDDGIGIAPENHQSIFMPFNQVNNIQVSAVSGTGLGLSISKHIVEHFGGKITLQSEPGRGSTFMVCFPITLVEREATPPLIEEKSAAVSEDIYFPIHVMLVEDDPWNALLMEKYLQEHVLLFHCFSTAQKALERIQEEPNFYSVVFTDLNLPDMDGQKLAVALAEKVKLPIFAVSASIANLLNSPEQNIFTDTLAKPFQKEQVLTLLKKYFGDLISEKPQADKALKDSPPVEPTTSSNSFSEDWDEELKDFFISSLQEKINTFGLAIRHRDVQTLGRIAHQLRSAYEQMGIVQFSETLQSIELMANLGKTERVLDEAGKLLAPLEAKFSDLTP